MEKLDHTFGSHFSHWDKFMLKCINQFIEAMDCIIISCCLKEENRMHETILSMMAKWPVKPMENIRSVFPKCTKHFKRKPFWYSEKIGWFGLIRWRKPTKETWLTAFDFTYKRTQWHRKHSQYCWKRCSFVILLELLYKNEGKINAQR